MADNDKPKTATHKIDDETWTEATGEWIDSFIRNSPIAANTEAWNHFHSVLDKFREILQKKL